MKDNRANSLKQFDGFGTGAGLPFPPPPGIPGGLGTQGFQTWLSPMSSAADRLEEGGEAESKRLSGIERILASIVRWFYTGKEPEGKSKRLPDYLTPGTVANNVYRAQQGYVEAVPPSSREGYRDEEQLFYRKAEDKKDVQE